MQVRRRRGEKKTREKQTGRETAQVDGQELRWNTSHWAWAVSLAVGACLLHSIHLSALFENDRFFSHLSPLERELSFRTEMGLYYSYYKRIVESPTVFGGVASILHDNLTEYPDTINTLQRFNLYPELCLSVMFRTYRWYLDFLGVSGMKCLPITRSDQSKVEACNGMGDPMYFYVHMIFGLNGLLASGIALLGAYISGSIWGGVLSTTAFLYNHGQSTRVMWTPPLRESFAMPVLFLQTLILSIVIRRRSCSLVLWTSLFLATVAFLLPWQFSQFTLLTQVLSVLVVHCLRLISSQKFLQILSTFTLAFAVSVVLQFGNTMLLTSFLPSCLLSCMMVCLLSSTTDHLKFRPLIMVVEVCVVIVGSVMVKMGVAALLGAKEDEHIISILLSKFTSYRDFHTQLYTCAAEFDFLPLSYVLDLTWTLLLPMAAVAMAMITVKAVRHVFAKEGTAVRSSHGGDDDVMATPPGDLAVQTYHLLQTAAYAVMATLIMRLKLFLSPQLAVVAGLLPSLLTGSRLSRSRYKWVVAGLLVCSSLKGCHNFHQQHSVIGEYNNPEGEQLAQWIRDHTPKTAVFAGTMPTMATVLLTTGRPIVNHPHYETASLRNRTYHVYTIFSRKSAEEIHSILVGMGADYVISEDGWCHKHRGKPGCSFSEMWDEEDPGSRGKPLFCEVLPRRTPSPFTLVYNNPMYRVLRVANSNNKQ